MRVGFHISIYGSIDQAVDRAVELKCNTFQIFTRNPRQWHAKKLTSETAKAFSDKVKSHDMKPVFAHMPYLPNLASPRDEVYEKSVKTLTSELERCRRLEIPYLVTHLGSHLGAGMQTGFTRLLEIQSFCHWNIFYFCHCFVFIPVGMLRAKFGFRPAEAGLTENQGFRSSTNYY